MTETASYHDVIRLDDGTEVTIRPIRPEDAEIEARFVRLLSPQSKFLRFHSALQELTPSMLEAFVHNDYPDAVALIATTMIAGEEQEIGVARYARPVGETAAEFAIVVADEWQGRGIGLALMQRLLQVADQAGIETLTGLVLRQNRNMINFVRSLGFDVCSVGGEFDVVRVVRTRESSGKLPVA